MVSDYHIEYFLFYPLLEKFCPLFKIFFFIFPAGVQFAQFTLPTFKFRPGKGVIWVGVGGVLRTYISPKGLCDG